MKLCFLTNGPIEWASARYRAFWVAECREDWAAYELEKLRQMPEADVYVFAKTFNIKLVQQLIDAGKRVYWDLCDPLHWFSPSKTREMLDIVDGVVCSNEGLADDLAEWCDNSVPTFVIPDRLKLSHYNKQRQHADVSPVRFIWFGSAQNRATLYPGFVTLTRLQANGYDVELTIMDNRPDMPLYYGPDCPVYFQRWNLETEVEVIANHDIALLPSYPGEWGRVKSDNKYQTAWACGLPTIEGNYDVAELLCNSPPTRENYIPTNRPDVEKSAQDWETLLNANSHTNELQPAAISKAVA